MSNKNKILEELKPTVLLPKLNPKTPKLPPSEKINKTKYARKSIKIAQRVQFPLFSPQGEIAVKVKSLDVTSTAHPVELTVKFYAGNAIIHTSSSHSGMVFATDSADDIKKLRAALKIVYNKMKQTIK